MKDPSKAARVATLFDSLLPMAERLFSGDMNPVGCLIAWRVNKPAWPALPQFERERFTNPSFERIGTHCVQIAFRGEANVVETWTGLLRQIDTATKDVLDVSETDFVDADCFSKLDAYSRLVTKLVLLKRIGYLDNAKGGDRLTLDPAIGIQSIDSVECDGRVKLDKAGGQEFGQSAIDFGWFATFSDVRHAAISMVHLLKQQSVQRSNPGETSETLANPLTDNDRLLLQTMAELDARGHKPETGAVIVKTALYSGDEKRAFRNLLLNKLVRSKRGKSGGYWLTKTGDELEKRLRAN